MAPTAVFDLDKVLLGGDASVLFLQGRLRQSPVRALPLMLAAPALIPGAVVPPLRPLAARAMTRIAVAGRAVPDAHAAADAYRAALGHCPEGVVADAIARVRQHLCNGDRVFAGTPRPVLVNASPQEQRRVTRVLGREPEMVVWK